jgi:membrane-bound lytic murein transglycosylase A
LILVTWRGAGAGLALTLLAAPVLAPSARAAGLADLPGWAQEDHAAAFAAYRSTCGAAAEPGLARACARARAAGPLDEAAARAFFEASFQPDAAVGEGMLTGYFAPQYPARQRPEAPFTAPLRGKPASPMPVPGPDRAAIEASPARDALAWLRPEDLFFLQVQGSGVLVFPDGRRAKALYAATNGRPYVAIGGPMRAGGMLAGEVSAPAIHAWLAEHRGPEADAVMRLNPRYVFFRMAPDDGRAPAGAAGLPLPARRALAVDPDFHPLGELLWMDADRPALAGARPRYRGLAVTLDTGSAIKGAVRADLYLGQGEAAGAEAGLARHALRLYRLAPR